MVWGIRTRLLRCRYFETRAIRLQPGLQTINQFQRIVTPHRALPDNGDPPPCASQGQLVPAVSLQICVELAFPEFRSRRWGGGVAATFMTMPETAANLDHRLPSWKHDIRCAGQLAIMEAEAKAASMQ